MTALQAEVVIAQVQEYTGRFLRLVEEVMDGWRVAAGRVSAMRVAEEVFAVEFHPQRACGWLLVGWSVTGRTRDVERFNAAVAELNHLLVAAQQAGVSVRLSLRGPRSREVPHVTLGWPVSMN